jgi:DNA-binding transcriptional ArsR family regulator
MQGDADLATVGAAIGEPARALMLNALLGGRALPATELAQVARIAPSTASAHLAKLTDAGLIAVEPHGRHRYHRLASDEVAHALEVLATIAPPLEITTLRAANRAGAERHARLCYDHLAGELGVALTDRLIDLGALESDSLALRDAGPLTAIGIHAEQLNGRRPLTRACLDWTERRPHVAGQVGAAVLTALLDLSWIKRGPAGRAVQLTPSGERGLSTALGLRVVAAGSP